MIRLAKREQSDRKGVRPDEEDPGQMQEDPVHTALRGTAVLQYQHDGS